MNPLLERPSALLAKIETTKGTPETLTTAEGAFNVFDVDFKETTGYTKREKQGGAGNLPGRPTAYIGTCTFRVHVENSGTSTAPAWVSTFLPACGMPGSSGVYTRTLDTSAQKTVTLTHYKGAGASCVKQTLAGAMGKCRLVGHSGSVNDFFFEFTGKYWEESTTTLLDPTEPTTLPPRGFETLTINSVNVMAPEFTLDFGQVVKMLEGPNDTNDTGFIHAIIADYASTFAVEPYAEALSVIDWRAGFAASTEWPLALAIGSGTNGTFGVAASKLQITGGPGFGKRERVYTRALNFDVNDDAGAIVTLS